MTEKPLTGIKLVNLSSNVPGPVAAARLVELGAAATKVEPPAGDPLKTFAGSWYDLLSKGQTVVRIDLKTQQGRTQLDRLLDDADLLLTSFRPSALRRLGIDWENLHPQHPRLCAVNIIGHPQPDEELPGHDLTYQAKLGVLRPPSLPITLYADMSGAERAVGISLALLLNFARTGQAGFASVSLYDVMREIAAPLAAGLTSQDGILGGTFPLYGLYRATDGWIAIAALEPAFAQRLSAEMELRFSTRAELEGIFSTRSASDWERWAQEHDLPIVKVE